MVRIEDKSRCSGCSACMSICPRGAIAMVPDAVGFRYPQVNEESCVDCGLCEAVCPFVKTTHDAVEPRRCLAMRNKDAESMMSSRSGAVFPELASWIIKGGGTVYGAGYDEEFAVVHKRAENISSCQEFRGSKYVQSELDDTFRQVHEDLRSGKAVLFTGTPCQCAGLKAYIPKGMKDRLYLVDLVCHGVPSPNVWKDNLKFQRNRLNSPMIRVSFRDKKLFGWSDHKESYSSASETLTDDRFTDLFFLNVITRDSCHACPYASTSRVSDITLADFWGWQKVLPGFNADNKGASLVLINSDKGEVLLNDILEHFESHAVSLAECLQPNLQMPSAPSPDRDRALKAYQNKGFHYLVNHYGSRSLKNRIKSIYLRLRKFIRRLLGL